MTETALAEQRLQAGLQEYGLTTYQDALMAYLLLLAKWNQAYNLTAIRTLPEMVTKHLLDSLAIAPDIHGQHILDVGTGAGLPGIPLAIMFPEKTFVLLDSNGKKTRFLSQVKRSLDLKNITIEQNRVEHYRPELNFDTVISRAFSELSQFIDLTNHLLARDGIWLAMKGHYPSAELAHISHPCTVRSYQVPGLEGQRCSVIIENKQ